MVNHKTEPQNAGVIQKSALYFHQVQEPDQMGDRAGRMTAPTGAASNGPISDPERIDGGQRQHH